MRIITGKYKGRILKTVRDLSVRPATDRVKSSIYNTLQNRLDLAGISVLDLFAGSGSLGFEALSRGAAEAVFVENNRRVLDLIRENAEALGCAGACTFVQMDAGDFLRSAGGRFHLVFIDPPYADQQTGDLPALVADRQLLAPGGYMIIEHSRQTLFPDSGFFKKVLVKQFGSTIVSFFAHPS